MNRIQVKYIFIFALAIAVVGFIACEGPEGPIGPQGPQGEQGPEGPQGPQGSEGTANATMYVFDGHSFQSGSTVAERDVELRDESELYQNVWLAYLIKSTECQGCVYSILGAYPVPGSGYFVTDFGDAEYVLSKLWFPDESILQFRIFRTSGNNQIYDNIHIIRIAPGEVMGKKMDKKAVIPEGLSLSDYHSVMNYYGLTEEDEVQISSQ